MNYHAMMLDEEGRIRGVRRLHCGSDAEAVEASRQVLDQMPRYAASEIWAGTLRRVDRITR
jgi:hypothetical protein